MYNLTENQKELLRQLVQKACEGHIPKEFCISQTQGGNVITLKHESGDNELKITQLDQDALKNDNLLQCHGQKCMLTGKAYEAVDNNFKEPDTSLVKHLTPLADITNLDEELKQRCLPILGAGSAEPKLWDSAVRTAGVILEDRLRDVGGISDTNCVGLALVNNWSEMELLILDIQII